MVRGERGIAQSEKYLFPFERLEVWQESIELADVVFGLLERIPPARHLRMVSQLEGAVTSIAQNIAEGKGRQHTKEFLQYLSIAQGSLYETVTLIEVFRRNRIFDEVEYLQIRQRTEQIHRKLSGLINSIRGKKRGERV